MRGVIIPNASPSKSADLILSGEEWERVKRLGSQVYPKYPVGFGDAALLVAYHFQCPNNTLPLIWADGENNKTGGSCYPWKPLFPYRPKPKGPTAKSTRKKTETLGALDFSKLSLELSDKEKSEVEAHAVELISSQVGKRLNIINWLNNFKTEEKELALKLLGRHKHCDLPTTRRFIHELGHRVSAELAPFGSDMGDVLLVTTGSEQESTYHYVFEFMREWHLEFRQVVDIEQLNATSALDRHLVFFYHTRPPGREFFEAKEALGGKAYFDLVEEAKPISTLLCSFAEAPGFKMIFDQQSTEDTLVTRVSIPEPSRSINLNLGEDFEGYSQLISDIFGSQFRYPPAEHLLVSYYFKTPEITSPFIWYAGEAGGGRAWVPLFSA
ncbi:hypothetical protein LP421_15960 [Rhizobium sp. RCAM05350]|nr:hypothetical protein LP421_15960 [Rhizobium sp. RCAM05350]